MKAYFVLSNVGSGNVNDGQQSCCSASISLLAGRMRTKIVAHFFLVETYEWISNGGSA